MDLKLLLIELKQDLVEVFDFLEEVYLLMKDYIVVEMMDCFFYRIIAVDKHEIVVTIDASNKITLDKFRESRQAIAALPSILDGYIKCKDPFKTQTLAYKVVVL